MMQSKRLLVILLGIAALLLLTPAKPVAAAPVQDDEVIFGDDLTLDEGDRVIGDLVIIGGNLTMRAGSRVDGNATVLGGRVTTDGTVEGDLVAIGGDVDLGEQALVEGDVVAFGGRVLRAEGARIGDVVQGIPLRDLRFWGDLRPRISRPESFFWSTVTTLGGAVILALLAVAIVAFWPTQTTEVGRTIVTAPLPSLGVGCLIYPLAISFSFIILITICLAPFIPVVILLVVAASLFGWVALGTLLGRWLARTTGWRGATPVALAGVGVFALSVITAVLGQIPCLGFLLVLLVASIGLGAVALSRFGTRRYGAPLAEAGVPAAPSALTTPATETAPAAEIEPQAEVEPFGEIGPPTEPEETDDV